MNRAPGFRGTGLSGGRACVGAVAQPGRKVAEGGQGFKQALAVETRRKDAFPTHDMLTGNLRKVNFLERFHLVAEHYFQGKFKEVAPPSPDDLEKVTAKEPDGEGVQVHLPLSGEQGSIFVNLERQYMRTFQPCTKQKQSYKELVLHIATQHQQLKEVLCPFL